MPYKHIASQLKKTELACRLHYHQLSFGSKARRHSHAPMNPYDRSSAPPPARSRGKTPQRPLPSFSPPASPPGETTDYSPSETSSQQQTPQSHNKPILPKPVSNTTTTMTTTHPSTNDTHSPLRLVTQDVDRLQTRQYVDMVKLDAIYDAHRLHFWSTIARTYGCNLSPATLEEAWRRAHGPSSGTSRFPPTPRGSPQVSSSSNNMLSSAVETVASSSSGGGKGGFTPINNNSNQSSNPKDDHNHNNTTKATTTTAAAPRHNSSFAISSLLTEDREVRSPREKKPEEDVEMEMN